ncbi:hypothetical protein [Methanoregula sp.]|jgi:hypothetical protein|uniref:hypothetical protein n=1 Tax=Methanoregula sp. TaxID=2052170 RepID=UPI003566CB19
MSDQPGNNSEIPDNTCTDNAVQVLQIYDQGSGDYTKERKQWLEKDPDKYIAAVLAHGKKESSR